MKETAEQFINDNEEFDKEGFVTNIEQMLIDFARLHITQLSENPTKLLTEFGWEFLQEGAEEAITSESILEAYPLENIK